MNWQTMISLLNDYSEGAHPRILALLTEHNLAQCAGYGEDVYSEQAKALIQKHLHNEQAQIHLVSGGTQANTVIIKSILRPHEAVIAAQSGHIAVHETGAIEATGHKVIITPSGADGKLTPELIVQACQNHTDEHMVKPKLVYISQTTENGSVYSVDELTAIRACCDELGLYLHIDGARLGAALVANKALSLAFVAQMADVFYIGGTKNGALIGEAIVIVNPDLQDAFRFLMKQHGALLAKGRLLGIQFLGLFEENVFFECAQNAHANAMYLAEGLRALGCEFLTPPQSNQIFPILPNTVIAALQEQFAFYTWQAIDIERSAVRLVTSWASDIENIVLFLQQAEALLNAHSEA